jgi:YidC/Oxa1 family membrane protein insertase
MTVTMPLMFGFFAMQMPAGLSIYFIVSNLIGMGIQWGTNRLLKDDDATALPRPAPAAAKSDSDQRSSSTGKKSYRKRGYKKRS